ncbi:MAG: NAD-dependent epimerase/dehydratase family protein [Bacteroidales bacterium]|nr:NAD-dependent epimerase/dehydratase family protein [Bacteroidales bacterium]
MKILVTGAAGFIGAHLSLALMKEGHQVVGIDNLNSYYDPSLKNARLASLFSFQEKVGKSFRFEKIDICNAVALSRLFADEQFELVCHLAAQAGVRYSIEHPEAYVQSNLVGFSNVMECCRRFSIKHFLFASSSSVYGNNQSIPYKESDRTDAPVSLYAATKKSNELMAHSYASLYELPTTGLRFFTVYGPWGRPDMAPFLFTKALFEGKSIKLFNHGDLMRDFTYIDDIIEGVVRILRIPPEKGDNNGLPFRILNIGNATPVQLDKFVSTLEQLTGITAKKEFLPMQPGDVDATWADVSALKALTDYSPSTSLEQGLSAFITWYKKYYL